MAVKETIAEARIHRTIEALRKNNINGYLAESREDAARLVREIVPKGARISCGGSVTLQESGILDLMRSGYYDFLDRNRPGITPEEIREIYLQIYGCDAFFTSANAITEQGELYNVDGNGNRISAIIYGPKKVIVIAGANKIVPNLEAAVYRVKTVAAPCNGIRLNTGTPCALSGRCVAVEGSMTDGCRSPKRMCVHYLTSGFQRDKDRIHVIFLKESLGY